MKLSKEHIDHLSEEGLLNYLNDKLPSNEMHAVEKHLLDCELCSDALEGFEAFPEVDLKQTTKALHERLKDRTKEEKNYYRWSIAASIAIVLTFSIFFLLDLTNNEKELALSTEEINETSSDANPVAIDTLIAEYSVVEETKLEVVEERSIKKDHGVVSSSLKTSDQEQPIPDTTEDDVTEDFIAFAEEEPVEEEGEGIPFEVMADRDLTTSDESFAEDVFDLAKQNAVAPSVVSEGQKRARTSFSTESVNENKVGQEQLLNLSRLIRGKVTADEDGTPIPGVNVIVKNTTTGTTTDMDGKFELELGDSDETLVFSFIGLITREVEVDSKGVLEVSMMTDASELSEVVVTAVSVEREGYSVSEAQENHTKPKPKNGYKKYKEYLKSSLKRDYPQEALQNRIKGKVKLLLTISELGEIDKIEIKKGLGYGCDEKAKSLVLNGPPWKAGETNGAPQKMTILLTVPFKLP